MENRWQPNPPDDQSQTQHLCKLLCDAPELLFRGIGCASIKSEAPGPFGDPQQNLSLTVQKWDTAETTSYALDQLRRLPLLKDPSQLITELRRASLDAEVGMPDPQAMVQTLLPGQVALYCCPTAMMAMDLQSNPEARFKNLFNGRVQWLEDAPILPLAKRLASVNYSDPTQAIFIHRFGLFVFGEDPQSVYNDLVEIVSQAEETFKPSPSSLCAESEISTLGETKRESLAALRQQISHAAGKPLLMQNLSNQALREVLDEPDLIKVLTSGPLSHPQAKVFGNGFLESNNLPKALPASNILLDIDLGLTVTGETSADLASNLKLTCLTLQSALLAWQSGEMQKKTLQSAGPPKPILPRDHAKDTMFTGEVALVTGAASGIGRGCALALLDRGAVVVGLDVNPDINQLSDSPAYLGMVCDLTDEAAVQAAFETTVRTFGGLDMVVLNAGIFTKSALIEELDLSMWQRVMKINLDANVTILREAYPLLKRAPADGRVLVNASRNVPAPGPGAAAYSTSKAGLTQLARVAALEWGKDGIRVNMIHPHAVFDTGIWTDEVLKSRAEKYGLSVKEYKTNNLLRVELTSRDVGELVCEMLGPVFSKTTGAQIPVDGGSDRVI